MFSIGGSRNSGSILGPNKDHIQSRQLSNMPFSNAMRYNHCKQFPEFKFSQPHQVDVIQPMKTKTNHNQHRKSPSKTKQKSRMMMEEIDEVGLDASLAEAVPQTPEASTPYTSCPLKIKLTDFLTSSFSCSPQKRSATSPKPTASPKSSSASPIEFLNFTWFFTPTNKSPCRFRQRLSSDCQSEDSFVVFANDGDELDSDCFTEDEDSEDDDTEDEESSGEMYHDVAHMDDLVDSKIMKKKVSFQPLDKLCVIHPMVKWSFAYRSARKGHWEELGRDRTRFSDRINNIAPTLNKILSPDHRNTIYHQRFVE